MKRYLLPLIAALLLAGCAAREDTDRAADIQRSYAAMAGCAARVEVAVARADETLRCTLDLERDGDETQLTVVEPEALAGVGVTVTGDALALRYDDMVLDAGSADENVSAVNAADIVLRAVASGWLVERGAEEDALRLCFETEQGGTPLRVAVWFDETNAPLDYSA